MTNDSTPARQAEIALLPKFTVDRIHFVADLALPIWKRLPNKTTPIYRLRTDAGECIIGRKVAPARAAGALTTDAPVLTPDDIFAPLIVGQTSFDLAGGLQLRRVGTHSVARSGFNGTLRDRLTVCGLFHEIISRKLRMFLRIDAARVAVLARVLDWFAIGHIGEREAV